MDEHTKQLGESLNRILDAIVANEQGRASDPMRNLIDKPRAMSLSEMFNSVDRGDEWVRDPVGQALRSGLRKIGKIVAENSSVQALHELAEWISEKRNDDEWGSSLLDAHWDGLQDKSGDEWIR